MTTDEDPNARHRRKQQNLKERVDAGIARADRDKGLLLVLTGDGKGKSTAGFGTVARAVGHGLSAAVCQFIKGQWDCGERELLRQHGVLFSVMATGFTWDTQDREADSAAAALVWEDGKRFLQDPDINVVLLDELTYMLSFKYLPEEEVLAALRERPPSQHVIVTGRGCPRSVLDLADTVSKIQSVRHAYDNGIRAQRGIDW